MNNPDTAVQTTLRIPGNWSDPGELIQRLPAGFRLTEVWTMGTHVMGLPDVVMRRSDLDADGETIIEVVRYLRQGEKPIAHGHVLADEAGPRFQVEATSSDKFEAGSPMYNFFGRLRLVSVKDIAERN